MKFLYAANGKSPLGRATDVVRSFGGIWSRTAAGCFVMAVRTFALILFFTFIFYPASRGQTSALVEKPTPYEVLWTTPSNDWNESIPIGNGEVGANVWLDGSGNLSILLSRTDAWDDYNRLVKVGGLVISLYDDSNRPKEPLNIEKLHPFQQKLDIQTGLMTASMGKLGNEVRWQVWVDAKRPVLVVEISSDYYTTPKASLALWRTEPAEPLSTAEYSDLFSGTDSPGSVYPDEILISDSLEAGKKIGWRHVNTTTPYFDRIGEIQGTAGIPDRINPAQGRIFGAVLTAAAPIYQDERTLYSQIGLRHRFEIAVTSLVGKTPEEWEAATVTELTTAAAVPIMVRRSEHTLWWSQFQARSWIRLSERKTFDAPALPKSQLFQATGEPLRIGLDGEGKHRFIGELTNFRIYESVLTEKTIAKLAAYYRLDQEDIEALSQYIALSDEQLVLLAAYLKLTKAQIDEQNKYYTPDERKLYALAENFTVSDVKILQTLRGAQSVSPYFSYNIPGHTLVKKSTKWTFPAGFSLELGFKLDSRFIGTLTEPMRLIDKWSQGAGFAVDLMPNGSLRLTHGAEQETYSATAADGNWHHFAFTVDKGDHIRFFVDGTEACSDRGRPILAGDEAEVVTRAYLMQRYLDACAGGGDFPIHFNGSIFTVPADGKPYGPDYRRLGAGYWWQNTRLPYYSKTAAGDFDQMKPLFTMYTGQLPVHLARTKAYFGFDNAAYFPECVYPWGDVFSEVYGSVPASERDDKLQASISNKYEWVSGLELVGLMLDYYEYTLNDAFFSEKLLPAADAVLNFFDQFYKTNEAGQWVMTPAQGLETWTACTNPAPEIAGLTSITSRLIALGGEKIGAERLERLQMLTAKIPPIPTRTDPETGSTLLAAAAAFADHNNIESPELYPVFPFRLFAFDKPNSDWALRAFEQRQEGEPFGWRQDELVLALLGQGEEARNLLVQRARNKDPYSRFPIFWGPNNSWLPDQDHGSILTAALQRMIMQCEGKKIYLLPAFPSEWDVDFKLYAPGNTIVSGKTVQGKIVSLTVEPKERLSDVIIAKPPKSERF